MQTGFEAGAKRDDLATPRGQVGQLDARGRTPFPTMSPSGTSPPLAHNKPGSRRLQRPGQHGCPTERYASAAAVDASSFNNPVLAACGGASPPTAQAPASILRE